jgi:hypothetical protein
MAMDIPNQSVLPEALDVADAARLLGCGKSTLDKLRVLDPGRSPPFFRIGRAVRYPVNGLRAWMTVNAAGGQS